MGMGARPLGSGVKAPPGGGAGVLGEWSTSTPLSDAQMVVRGRFPPGIASSTVIAVRVAHWLLAGLLARPAGFAVRLTLSIGRGPWKSHCFSLGLLRCHTGVSASCVEGTGPDRYPPHPGIIPDSQRFLAAPSGLWGSEGPPSSWPGPVAAVGHPCPGC